jgi:hypothetical protein
LDDGQISSLEKSSEGSVVCYLEQETGYDMYGAVSGVEPVHDAGSHKTSQPSKLNVIWFERGLATWREIYDSRINSEPCIAMTVLSPSHLRASCS